MVDSDHTLDPTDSKTKSVRPGIENGARHQNTWARVSSELHIPTGESVRATLARTELSLTVDAADLYQRLFPPEKQYQLYKTADALNSIQASDVRQGDVNDCFFMASLAAVADTAPRLIRDAIKTNSDGSYTVTFPGAKNAPVHCPALTASELREYAKESSDGVWPGVMEKAFGIYLSEHPAEKDKILMRDNKGVCQTALNFLDNHLIAPFRDPQALADTGDATAVLQLLTGNPAGGLPLKLYHSVDGARSTLSGAFADNEKVPTVAMIDKDNKTAAALGLHPNHGYTVLGYSNGLVTLRDPNGLTAPNDLGKAIASKDGVFTLNVEDFAVAFDALYTGRLRPLYSDGIIGIGIFRGSDIKKQL